MPPLNLLGLIPALIVVAIAERWARGISRPSVHARGLACVLGIAIIAIVSRLEPAISFSPFANATLATSAWNAYVGAAAVEESLKLLTVLALANRSGASRTGVILLAAYAAMGFAGFENVHHLADESSLAPFVRTLLRRSVLTVPMHAAATGLAAAMYVRRKRDGDGPGLAIGLAVAVAVHGSFDFALDVIYLPARLAHQWYRTAGAVAAWLIPPVAILALRACAVRLRDADLASRPVVPETRVLEAPRT